MFSIHFWRKRKKSKHLSIPTLISVLIGKMSTVYANNEYSHWRWLLSQSCLHTGIMWKTSKYIGVSPSLCGLGYIQNFKSSSYSNMQPKWGTTALEVPKYKTRSTLKQSYQLLLDINSMAKWQGKLKPWGSRVIRVRRSKLK